MNLAELQSRVASALMSPLTGSDSMAPRTVGGKKIRTEINELIKPNDRLTSLERLEIYSRSYWFRILDGFPGLGRCIGAARFPSFGAGISYRLPVAVLYDAQPRFATTCVAGDASEFLWPGSRSGRRYGAPWSGPT